MDKYFKQALRLARQTGDKLFVYDSGRQEEPVILMGLEAYKRLWQDRPDAGEQGDDFRSGGLTDSSDIDRINRGDTGIWNEDGIAAADFGFIPDFDPNQSLLGSDFGDYERGDSQSGRKKNPNWSIPTDRKAAAAAILEAEAEDEDTHYLEELPKFQS